MRASTKVVREKEAIRPARFESEQAQQYFTAGVHDLQAHKQSFDARISAFPLLWFSATASELSDNAIYNDQLSACDTNADGVISMQEALVFRGKVTEQIQLTEKNKPKTDSNDGNPTPPTPLAQKPSERPPALIHLSSKTSEASN